MKKALLYLNLFLFLITFYSCSSKEVSQSKEDTSTLIDGKWDLIKIGGQEYQKDTTMKEAYIYFKDSEKHVSGTTGCNNFMASYTISGNSLSFSPIATTMMACSNMEDERIFLDLLSKVDSYKIVDTLLSLLNNQETLMVFQKNIVPDMHTSKDSLDWAGRYVGTIPTASGMGMDIEIEINYDLTYYLKIEYLGKEDSIFESIGSFYWHEDGQRISLIEEEDYHFFVGENMLIKLDIYGNKISGPLADNYILSK